MDDIHSAEASASSEVYTIGYLEPVHGQRIEMDYTGQHIAGRYQVQQHIGSGGMADVYRAHDERLCCDVALKFLKPRLASEEWCARMVAEARASAAIDHPHVLRITDVGRVGPSVYLAMDLLTGASLETVLRGQPERRISWRRAIELFLPVLAALQAAHDAGFIHRDIKPDNLFLRRQGHEEAPHRPRLRHRQAHPWRRPWTRAPGHRHRLCPGHPGVYVARTGQRPAARPCRGHLLRGRDAVSRAQRPSTVRRRAR